MTEPRLFDAHTHLPNYPAGAGLNGARLALCAGTGPEDWEKVRLLAAGRSDIVPCFGLHPWFIEKAGADWLPQLEKFLLSASSCIGEIGLDKAADSDLRRQEIAFRAQLELAARLARPVVIHCVRAWSAMTDILKEERPPAFMVHAYGGPPEITAELVRLGGYFSFRGGLTAPGRAKMRKALLSVPPDRLLFETEAQPPAELSDVLAEAAAILGLAPGALGEISWNNARSFLGELFPDYD